MELVCFVSSSLTCSWSDRNLPCVHHDRNCVVHKYLWFHWSEIKGIPCSALVLNVQRTLWRTNFVWASEIYLYSALIPMIYLDTNHEWTILCIYVNALVIMKCNVLIIAYYWIVLISRNFVHICYRVNILCFNPQHFCLK